MHIRSYSVAHLADSPIYDARTRRPAGGALGDTVAKERLPFFCQVQDTRHSAYFLGAYVLAWYLKYVAGICLTRCRALRVLFDEKRGLTSCIQLTTYSSR